MKTMNNKASEILHDCYLNLVAQLKLCDIAELHGTSKAYVSQVAKAYGIFITDIQFLELTICLEQNI